MPERIQRKRTKGWRLPKNTVCVSRPGLWGNPFSVAEHGARKAVSLYRLALRGQWQEVWERGGVSGDNTHTSLRHRFGAIRERLAELRGRNLACWCPIGSPCHADVLLKIANEENPHAS